MIRGHVIHPGLKAVQQVFQKRIAWIKIFWPQISHYGKCLRLETFSCINAMMFNLVVLKIEEHNMRKVREGEKMVGKIR